jgi:type IV pilus assembly protein PilV
MGSFKLPRSRVRRTQRGISMIEVLVTMMIVALAMLGAVGLQAHAMRLNQGGQFRTHAVFLAGDLAERMEANKVAAVAGDYVVAQSTTAPAVSAACSTGTCTADQLAEFDLSQWQNAVASTLPQASWSVTQSTTGNPSTYTIVISWVDRRSKTEYATSGSGETSSYTATRTVLE